MKHIAAACLPVFMSLSLVLVASPAAAEGPYLTLSIGCGDADFFSIVRGDNNADGGFHTKEGFDIERSPVFSVAVGRRLFTRLRAELEASHHSGFDVSERFNVFGEGFETRAKLKSTGLFLNGYFDSPHRRISPYVGAGIGYARNDVGDLRNALRAAPQMSFSVEGVAASSLAWQVMAGMTIRLGRHLSMDLGGRYRDLGRDLKIDNVVGVSYSPYTTGRFKTRDLRLGVMYRF